VRYNSPERVLFQRGVACVELGRYPEAVELFEVARDALPVGYRRDHGRYAANLAIAAPHDGQDRAVAAGSAHTVTDLRRMRSALAAWEDSPAVRAFDDALTSVGA
jgi:hypothetical protein